MLTRPQTEGITSILVVGSASPFNVGRAVAAMRERFGGAQIVVLQPTWRETATRPSAGVATIEWRGVRGFSALGRFLALLDCDVKLVLFTGEGYNILKLLAFLLPGRRLLVFTEGGGVFEWCWAERYTIRNHVAWRLRGWPRFAALTLARGARAVFKSVLSALQFAGLLIWYARLWVRRKMGR